MEHFNPDFMRIKGSIDNLCVLAHLVHVAPPDGPPELSGNYNAEHSLVAFIINPHGPTPSIYTPALLRLRRVARDGRYDPGVPATRSSDGSFLFCGTPGVRKPSPRTVSSTMALRPGAAFAPRGRCATAAGATAGSSPRASRFHGSSPESLALDHRAGMRGPGVS